MIANRPLLCWLLLALLLAGPAARATTPAHALLEQQVLPALRARQASAEARVAAAQSYFAGREELGAAFPDLVDAPLGDPEFLAAEQWQIEERARERAAEQVAPPPDGLSSRDAQRWRAALAQAADREAQADALRQRLLAGLQAGLAKAPGLCDAEIAKAEAQWMAAAKKGERAHTEGGEHASEAGGSATKETEPAGSAPRRIDSAQARRVAAAGEARAALKRWRALAWRAMTVPGDEGLTEAVRAAISDLPTVWPDDPAAQLADSALADRLRRVLPLLPPALAAQAREAADSLDTLRLNAELANLKEELATGPGGPATQAGVQEAEEALHAAKEARASLPSDAESDDDPVAALRRQVADLRVQLWTKRLDARRTELDRAKHLAAAGVADPSTLQQTRQQAEAAREKARHANQGHQAAALLRARIAALRQEIADLVEAESRRRKQVFDRLHAEKTKIDDETAALAEARALPPLDPKRKARLDAAYTALRNHVTELRKGLDERRKWATTVRSQHRERLRTLQAVELPTTPGSDAITEWHAASRDLRNVLAEREAHADDELDAWFGLLRTALAARRSARRTASAAAQQAARRDFLPELMEEVAAVPIEAVAGWHALGGRMSRLPSMLVDITLVWALLWGSAELWLLSLAWWWARRRVPQWVEAGLERVHQAQRGANIRSAARAWADRLNRILEPGDLRQLGPAAGALARQVVDLSVAVVLLSKLGPLLGALVWIWIARIAWRAVEPMLDVLLTTDRRPALRRVSPETRRLVVRTVRVLLGWWLVTRILDHLALGVLDADRIDDLVHQVSTLVAAGLAIYLLHGWADPIRTHVARSGQSPLPTWIVRPDQRPPVALIQAILGLGLLVGRALYRLGASLVTRRAGLDWIAAAVARRRLREAARVPHEPCASQTLAALSASRGEPPGHETVRQKLMAIHQEWRRARRGGLVVVIGDRGSGKTALLRSLDGTFADAPVAMLQAPDRVRGTDEALSWLGVASGAWPREGEVPTGQALTEALLAMEPRVFAVDDLQRLFLRAVGGFDGIRVAIDVMHACSAHHFWICAMHGPTWSWLQGVPEAVSLAPFRERVQLAPLAAADLADWIKTGAERAGVRVAFDGLVGPLPAGADRERARARAEAAYWRLLADACQGNPAVAHGLWLASLSRGTCADEVEVGLFCAPATSDLADLPDSDLFVLTALVQHDGLDIDDLARVLNLGPARLQSICRRLQSREALVALEASDGLETNEHWEVSLPWLPAVERILRQKHFLYER